MFDGLAVTSRLKTTQSSNFGFVPQKHESSANWKEPKVSVDNIKYRHENKWFIKTPNNKTNENTDEEVETPRQTFQVEKGENSPNSKIINFSGYIRDKTKTRNHFKYVTNNDLMLSQELKFDGPSTLMTPKNVRSLVKNITLSPVNDRGL